MNRTEEFSDEFLSAFVDGQLDDDEKVGLLEAARRDASLSRRVCEMQKVRDMVQLAYQNVAAPAPCRSPTASLRRGGLRAVAAAALLATGVLCGWVAKTHLEQQSSLLELAQTIQQPAPGAATAHEWRVMLHVSSADPTRLNTLLEETQNLLEASQHGARKVRVEVLTNGAGLQLLNADNSPYAARIRALQRKYDNLSFLACSKALQRLKKDKGISLDLVPQAKVVPSAVGEIIKRQREGWTYIHI